ncbi:hypothetical protein AOQ84DRAFT_388639 [Glonium stellatum]|uniref:SnoaL-like domain-containing protein n=1 Tax=Glonium stellatum TaxID=574774 RepID=A0A8E2F230_9PEZI|nr:hypothetical protein AOQ84DRAFT_388639 [Glonium stellatum]
MTTPRTEWPSTPIPEPIKHLLNKFYSLGDQKSDDASRQLGEDVFTPTGQIVVNKRTINGPAEIAVSNHGFWEGIKTRHHEVLKIYTCNDAADDLMLIGSVTWGFENGQIVEAGFCARAVIDDSYSEKPKLQLYQGWIDPSEMQDALKQQ